MESYIAQTPEHTLTALLSGRLSPQLIPRQSVSSSDSNLPACWEDLIPLARRHGLAPYLLWVVRQSGVDIGEDSLWQPLLESARRSTAWYILATSTRAKIDAALKAAGIPTIWLKGMALAPTVYPEPVLRPMVDVDVLVPYNLREQARAVVERLGYRPASPPLFTGAQDFIQNYTLRTDSRAPVTLELHYRLLDTTDRLLPLSELEWFWQQTQTAMEEGESFQALRPEAHLLYLCAHALLQHSEAEFRLLRYLDLHLLVTHSPSFNWARVIEQAVVLKWTYAVAQALRTTREYFSTSISDEVLREMEQRRPWDEDITLVTRAQGSAGRWQRAVRHYARLSWPARLRLLSGGLIPTAAYMRWRYRIDSDWKIPLYYVYRWFVILRELVRTVFRRLPGTPER